MGTAVVRGECVAKVIATGMQTQMGKIANMIENIEKEPTPLQKKLGQMGKFLIILCLLVCFFVILIGVLRGEDVLEMIMIGLSLAVASVPEGLPAIVTIVLAFAVKRMVKRKALVRKLHAVETLGCANVICTDKTGTITQNKITVKKFITLNGCFNVQGQGLNKDGEILMNGNERITLKDMSYLKKILTTAVICNSSEIFTNEHDENSWSFYGDPTEAALLIAAFKGGVNRKQLNLNVLKEIPFDSSKKYMTVLAKDKYGKKFVFVKGAYDVILKKCKFYEEMKTFVTFLRDSY